MATTVTVADLFNAGRRITRMDAADYGGYAQGWRDDSNHRRRSRNAANKARAEHCIPWDTIIPAGEHGRITISPDGSIRYCAGQYAPTEYYWHVAEVCHRLHRLRSLAA